MREGETRLAEQPVKRGARLVALRRLRAGERAFVKAIDGNVTGLHVFRVALRRLRTVLRLYHPWLEESVPRKCERRLRRITRASNNARDYEVFADVARRLGVQQVADRLFAREHTRALAKFQKIAADQFPQLARTLKRGLSNYPVRVKPGRQDDLRFGVASAGIVRDLARELIRQFDGITTVDQEDKAHEARITAKRLRYTLEPFRRQIESCKVAVTYLKAVQADLGELHDLQVLASELERKLPDDPDTDPSEIAHVFAAMHAAITKSFESAAHKYFNSGGTIAALLEPAAKDLTTQARTDVEIERKFLLRQMPRLRGAERVEIVQGYLPGSAIRERVRAVTSQNGKKYYRTIKSGTGMIRREVEEEIDEDLFKQLWRLTRGRRIRKRRYTIPSNNGTWMIDKFKDRPLYLAEIELNHEHEEVALPRWLRKTVVADVTDDENYTNHALAK